jgi:diaminopimelate epimerase
MSAATKFCKMHGLGNDFVVINAISQPVPVSKSWVRALAHRHTGIGFDQLLIVQPSTKADFACRIFNADGSEAEQCGNGIRCVARYVHEENLTSKKSLSLETPAGLVDVVIHDYNSIQVSMGIPQFDSENKIVLKTPEPVDLFVLSIGNPHAILQVSSLQSCAVATIGTSIGSNSYFPNGTNVGFMEIVDRENIRLRTFERGVGETLACGSNACASVVAGIQQNLLAQKVRVELPLGHLWIEWAGKNHPVLMTGSASRVFDGEF